MSEVHTNEIPTSAEVDDWLGVDPELRPASKLPRLSRELARYAGILAPRDDDPLPKHAVALVDAVRHLQDAVRALHRLRGLD